MFEFNFIAFIRQRTVFRDRFPKKNDAVSSADPKVLMKNRQRSFFISAKPRSAINLQYKFFMVFHFFLLWKNVGFECFRNRLRKFNLFRANPFYNLSFFFLFPRLKALYINLIYFYTFGNNSIDK